jgi:hypothetical protein
VGIAPLQVTRVQHNDLVNSVELILNFSDEFLERFPDEENLGFGIVDRENDLGRCQPCIDGNQDGAGLGCPEKHLKKDIRILVEYRNSAARSHTPSHEPIGDLIG